MGSNTKKEPEFDVYDLSEIIVMDKKDYALYRKEAEISALKAGGVGVQYENSSDFWMQLATNRS